VEELRKKEEELKKQIDIKVSTKFHLNPSTNGWEKCTQSDMGTDHPTNRPTIQRTDEVFYRGACWRLKRESKASTSPLSIFSCM
jgi:hypothetical protein